MKRGIDWAAGIYEAPETDVEKCLTGREIKPLITLAIAVFISALFLYRGIFGSMTPRTENGLLVGLLLCYTFLIKPMVRRKDFSRWWISLANYIFIIAAVLSAAYVMYDSSWKSTRTLEVFLFSKAVRFDYIVGIIVILILFEATRRITGGIVLVALSVILLLYALFGNYMPGFMENPPVSWTVLIDGMFIESEGVYGVGPNVLYNMLGLFLMFAMILQYSKTGAFFTSAANSLIGYQRGGPAKVAVIGSALMGTMTGSAIANVVGTGCVTIPLMKRLGYRPEFAASVEAVASSGGQIMPPILGAAGFLMAAITGIPYSRIILYCAIPAILYYAILFVIVHAEAVKANLLPIPRDELPSLWRVLVEGGHLVLPVFLLIGLLLMNYSVLRVGFWAAVSILLLSFVRRETRLSPLGVLGCLEGSVRRSLDVFMACLVVGVVVGAVNYSGLGMKIAMLTIHLSAGSLFVALLLGAVFSIILGMGIPTLFVYINMVLFIIPGLTELGVSPLAAHLFSFYFGVASGLTPPVCLVAFAAAGIAGSDPMKTGFVSSRLGAVIFILPFLFVYQPAILIMNSSIGAILQATFFVALGLSAIAFGIHGFIVRQLSFPSRLLSIGAGVLLLFPNLTLQLIGLVSAAALVASQMVYRRKVSYKRSDQ